MTENEVTSVQAEAESVRPVIKTGLFHRIFGWKKISDTMNARIDELHEQLSVEQEGRRAEQVKYDELKQDYTTTVSELSSVKSELAVGTEKISMQESQISDLEGKLTASETKCSQLTATNTTLSQRVTKEDAKLLKEETSWKNHVADVKAKLNEIAQKNDIIKISTEDYQYAGSPQNAFLFSKKYTIFDAINPASQASLPTFQKEVREYAESMKKYYKNDVVRSDIYLVVPTSACSALDTVSYSFKAYTVHVITPDTMQSILMMLKELEAYDFSTQLAIEGQEKVCQILARLSITAKKKVQLDAMYSKEMVAALKEINSLPANCTSEILNFEERNKLLALESLSSDVADMERTYIDYTTSKEA